MTQRRGLPVRHSLRDGPCRRLGCFGLSCRRHLPVHYNPIPLQKVVWNGETYKPHAMKQPACELPRPELTAMLHSWHQCHCRCCRQLHPRSRRCTAKNRGHMTETLLPVACLMAQERAQERAGTRSSAKGCMARSNNVSQAPTPSEGQTGVRRFRRSPSLTIRSVARIAPIYGHTVSPARSLLMVGSGRSDSRLFKQCPVGC